MPKYTRPRIFPDGTIIYPRRGWEPPPPIPGYIRKGNNPRSPDAWTFLPLWSACPHRIEKVKKRENCQCLMIYHVCDLNEDIPVTTQLCSNCPLFNNASKSSTEYPTESDSSKSDNPSSSK